MSRRRHAPRSVWSRMVERGASPRGLRSLSLWTLAGLWLIVPSGALVRLTASGLGCPDWPGCGGGVVPALSGHQLIEYSNRIFSAVVAVLALLSFVVTRRLPARERAPRRWATALALATVGQVPLGGITVLTDLHPLAVSSHFLLSMVALALGVLFALSAADRAAGRQRDLDLRRGALALTTALALAVVLVTGVLVTAAGPHAGDPGVVQRFGDLPSAASVHVRAAVAFVAVAVVLALWMWREGGLDAIGRRVGLAVLPLVALQIGIGEYQYRNRLPWEVVALHVPLAGLIWAAGVAVCWSVLRPTRAGEPAARRVGAGSEAVPGRA